MMTTKKLLLLLAPVVFIFIMGCTHKMAPANSSSVEYDKAKDHTVYTESPYGTVSLPGKWMQGKFNQASRQQYFYHPDTATLIVAIGPCTNYPFAKHGLEGYEFVQKYYDVEYKYQTQLLEQTPKLLVEDKDNRYMIWMVRQDGVDQYFLCGVKDCTCNECTYRSFTLKSRKYNEQKAKDFLKGVFLAP